VMEPVASEGFNLVVFSCEEPKIFGAEYESLCANELRLVGEAAGNIDLRSAYERV
jgi:hypothetical protein